MFEIRKKITEYKNIVSHRAGASWRDFPNFFNRKKNQSKEIRIAVQCPHDPYYLTLFTHICSALQKRSNIGVDLLFNQSLNASIGLSLRSWLLRSFPFNRVRIFQWDLLWSKLSGDVAYKSYSILNFPKVIQDGVKGFILWRNLNSIEDLEGLIISGIPCGDLVIDTYLRFRPSPKVNIKDFFIFLILWQSIRDLRQSQHYFRNNRPSLYITSYTTYIFHGIPVRVALQEGIKLISFGNAQDFGMFHSQDYFYQTKDSSLYKSQFNSLANSEFLMRLAEKELESRLSGAIDNTVASMKYSAYGETNNVIPDVEGAVIVFMHDFYDSPHVYPNFIFPDFWAWICFTIDTLDEAGVKFFLKPHPNQVKNSETVLLRLQEKYAHLKMIDPSITNNQFVRGGIACAITAYGTVSSEMAYMGIPSIACASHPHQSFDFCKTAKSRVQYADFLRKSNKQAPNQEFFREQSLQFYVMHNLNYSKSQIDLRNVLLELLRKISNKDIDILELKIAFNKIANEPYFESFIERIHALISIPKS
jgi:hypothetical protein